MPPAPTRLTSRCSVASAPYLSELGLATDQLRKRLGKVRRAAGHSGCAAVAVDRRSATGPDPDVPARGAGHLGPVWASGPRAQDFLVELGGFRLGLSVLSSRFSASTQSWYWRSAASRRPSARVEPHDRAVDGLLQRVQREETEAGLDGRLGGAGLLLMDEEAAQALDGQLVQTLPLGREPLLERALGQRQPGQQVAAVEAGDLLERLGAAIGDQSLEPRHVHIDDPQGPGPRLRPVEDQAGLGAPGQGLPDSRERVAQVAPSLGILHVSPQKGRELLARVGLAERDSQVGQEGLGLPGGEDERSAGFELCLKSPQKREFQACRGLQCSSRVPARGVAEYAIGPHRPPPSPRPLTPFLTLHGHDSHTEARVQRATRE